MDKIWEDEFWQGSGVLPLGGKYYGTVVNVGHTSIKVWDHLFHDTPSRRQLDDYGYEGKEWDDLTPEERWDITCDSHYETQADYDLALKIAALPDLISALDDLVSMAQTAQSFLPVDFNLQEWIDNGRKALAQAYGEENL